MKTSKYRFTVFTPCYNSEKYIHRVIESLEAQTFKNFEWLVVNDASTDSTHQLLSEYQKKAPFSMNYFNLEKNQMVTANYNLAIREAQGELMIPFGHDDRIEPDTLATFDQVWEAHADPRISAIYGLAKNQFGELTCNKYPEDVLISDYFTVCFSQKNEGEKIQCYSVKVLREYPPFDLSIDTAVPSGWLWGQIGCDYQAIFINRVLRTYYIEPENKNALSKTKRPKYANGVHFYYRYWINLFQYKIQNNTNRRLRGYLGYLTYGLLAKKTLSTMLVDIEKPFNKFILILFYPIAILINKKNGY